MNHVPGFIVAQLIGAAAGATLALALFPVRSQSPADALAPGE